MVAAFLAAFMSTIGTQLNWGSSYLVNDLYKRFFVRDATEKHYVLISKIFTVAAGARQRLHRDATDLHQSGMATGLNIGFGTGAVYILRWYWSRINAWSEISAMAVAAADDHRAEPRLVQRQRCAGLCEDGADHRSRHDHRMGDCDIRHDTPNRTRR